MMNCQDIEILIQKAIDNNLSEAGQEVLHAHLSTCPACAQLYQEYVELDQMLKTTLPDVVVPEDLSKTVMSAVNDLKVVPLKTASPKRKTFRRVSLVVSAAALFLAVSFSGLFESPDSPDDPGLPIAEINPDDIDTNIPDVNNPSEDLDDANQQDLEQTDANNPQADPDSDSDAQTNPENNDSIPPANNGLTTHSDTSQTYGGGISLPQVAYGGTNHGSYSLYTLASHEDYDAILPRVKDNIVTYYLNADGYYLEWQTDLNRGSEPVFVGEIESLPAENTIAGFADRSSEYGYNYVVANANDGMRQAINCGGEDAGLWMLDLTNANATPVLVDSNNGGGKIVSWAPDSNKVLYTSANGSLHVYYPNENVILDIYSGQTSYVCWASDSKNIVFSAMDDTTGHLSIFGVIVP